MRTHLRSLLALLLLTSPLRADQILLHTGQTLTGTITAEDPASITLRSSESTATLALTRKINKSAIKQITRPQHRGPPYVTLPIHGVIGQDITPALFKSALAEAHAVNAKYILLDIDSPGGNIGALVEILDALAASSANGHTIVAHVKTAYSSAAVLAMSCPHVYMTPGSVLGAAVPYRATTTGPADIEAKARSAIGAKLRTYVTAAGHNGLLLRAMMETDVTVYLDTADPAHPKLSPEPPGRLIKEKGTILTLTATEAVECGLATLAPDPTAIAAHLLKGPWHQPTQRPAELLTAANASASPVTPTGKPKPTPAAARFQSQFDAIAREISDLTDKSLANTKATLALNRSYESELSAINADYEATLSRSKSHADASRARETRAQRLAFLRHTTQPTATRLREEFDSLRLRMATLRSKQRTLLTSLPQD